MKYALVFLMMVGTANADCLLGDLNNDLTVNSLDTKLFMLSLGTDNPKSDFNYDGVVDFFDAGIFIQQLDESLVTINFDVNLDGKLSSADLDFIKMLSEVTAGTSGDINCDGKISEEEVNALENVLEALGLK